MSDQLQLLDEFQLGIGMRFSDGLKFGDGFIESQQIAGYALRLTDSLQSMQEGQIKITFRYVLMISETTDYWSDASTYSLNSGINEVLLIVGDATLACWQDFLPAIVQMYNVDVKETFTLTDLISVGLGLFL